MANFLEQRIGQIPPEATFSDRTNATALKRDLEQQTFGVPITPQAKKPIGSAITNFTLGNDPRLKVAP